MREDNRGQEYLDENFCSHDDVVIRYFDIINEGEDVLVSIQCEKCGDRQDHTLDLEQIIWDLDLEWVE
jgi:hypothetical protein|tara:strand:- start:246 stop:449 length:204 start_codon:yes stop_codon:yes gene_type:complete